MLVQGLVGPNRYGVGSNNVARTDKDGQLVVEMNGRLYENAYNGRLFNATAIVTAPGIYSTAAGVGGPLLWNGSSTVNAVLLKVGYSIGATVSTVAGGLGITGGVGQQVAPTATTAITAVKNNFIGGALPLCTAYQIGTPLNAGNFFIPLFEVGTGATSVAAANTTWIDLEGSVIVPPQAWASIAASVILSTLVITVALVWAEVPV